MKINHFYQLRVHDSVIPINFGGVYFIKNNFDPNKKYIYGYHDSIIIGERDLMLTFKNIRNFISYNNLPEIIRKYRLEHICASEAFIPAFLFLNNIEIIFYVDKSYIIDPTRFS